MYTLNLKTKRHFESTCQVLFLASLNFFGGSNWYLCTMESWIRSMFLAHHVGAGPLMSCSPAYANPRCTRCEFILALHLKLTRTLPEQSKGKHDLNVKGPLSELAFLLFFSQLASCGQSFFHGIASEPLSSVSSTTYCLSAGVVCSICFLNWLMLSFTNYAHRLFLTWLVKGLSQHSLFF